MEEELDFDVDIDAGGVGDEFEDYEDLYEDVNVGFFPAQEAAPVQAEQEQAGGARDWQREEENGKPNESRQEVVRSSPVRSSRVSDPRLEQQRKDSAPVTGESPGPAVESTPPQKQQSPVVTSRPPGEGKLGVLISELHWWTTDADLEAALAEYGRHKGLKFSEERASGRSKGFCQIEFYDAASAQLCKEKMNGRVFNGRPCIVQYATQQLLKQMNNIKPQAPSGQQQHSQSAPKKSSGGRGEGRGYGGGKPGMGMGGGRGPGRGRGRGGGSSDQFGQMAPGHIGMYDPGFMRPGMYGMGYMPRGPAYPMPFAPGVAPHVNPAFFGRGANGHMMGNPGWGNGAWGVEEGGGGYSGAGGGGGYDDDNGDGDEGGKGDGGGGGESRKRSKDERDVEWDRERQHKEKERDRDRDRDRDMDTRERDRDHRGWEKERSYKSRDRRYEEEYDDDYSKKRRH